MDAKEEFFHDMTESKKEDVIEKQRKEIDKYIKEFDEIFKKGEIHITEITDRDEQKHLIMKKDESDVSTFDLYINNILPLSYGMQTTYGFRYRYDTTGYGSEPHIDTLEIDMGYRLFPLLIKNVKANKKEFFSILEKWTKTHHTTKEYNEYGDALKAFLFKE